MATAKETLTDLILTISRSNYPVLALDSYEPDKMCVFQSINDLFRLQKINDAKLYRVSLCKGLLQPVYSKQKKILSWKKSDMFADPNSGNIICHYLREINNFQDEAIFFVEDFQKYLGKKKHDSMAVSILKDICQLRGLDSEKKKRIILLGQHIDLHPDIFRQIPIFSLPLPSKKAIALSVRDILGSKEIGYEENDPEMLADSGYGLTFYEISGLLQKHINSIGSEIDIEAFSNMLNSRKYQVLKENGIEFLDSNDFPEVGGHELFKQWIEEVELRRTIGAQFGLPIPKGCLLAGLPGTGKTLLAKVIAKKWNVPLLILNIPALKGALVGESEGNLRKALALIDLQEAVVLIDEIEKAVNEGHGDNTGVSSGMLSELLFWLNEQSSNFVIATANNVSSIPQELLRAGRFDRRWFVDLPTPDDRKEIIRIHLTRKNRCTLPSKDINLILNNISDKEFTDLFSGAELEQLVIQALTLALRDGRPQKPNLGDFRNSLSRFKVLARAFPEQYRLAMKWSANADSKTSKQPEKILFRQMEA